MPIDFSTSAVESLYALVIDDLEEAFGAIYVSETLPMMVLALEDAEIRLFVAPLGEDTAAVRVVCWIARDINSFEPALMRYLLEQTGQLPFGRFGIDDDGDIFFDFYVHGEGYSREQLLMAVATVYDSAVRAERHLVLHWGGARKPN